MSTATPTPAVSPTAPERRPPIPSRRWRRTVAGVVCLAGAVAVLAGGSATVGVIAFTAVPVALVTVWALRAPAGWGALTLVVVQALAALVPWGVPRTVVDWALAAAVGCAVLATHLCLSLLAAWPVRADLPRPTAARWMRQGAVLSLLTVLGAALGLIASTTPVAWGPFLAAGALLVLAALAWAVRIATRRGGR